VRIATELIQLWWRGNGVRFSWRYLVCPQIFCDVLPNSLMKICATEYIEED